MLNLTCMVLVFGTLVLQKSSRALVTRATKIHFTQFAIRWISALVLLIAGVLAHVLIGLDAQAGQVLALTWLIDIAFLFSLTTMIWSLVLLLLSVTQRSAQS
jgi:hypothetical protein